MEDLGCSYLIQNVKYFQETVKTTSFSLFIFVVFTFLNFYVVLFPKGL